MVDAQTRKQLKREYRESHRPAGVYRVTNTVSGRMFVASSVNLPAVFNRLRMQLETGSYLKHPDLQKDWKELGAEAFEIEVLEELEPPDSPDWDPIEDLAALEALWLEELQPYDERGYNRRPRAG